MKNTHGFDYPEGGNRGMSTAYMARGDGPVLEEDDPYNTTSPKDKLPIQKRLTNSLYIPDRIDSSDNNLIKDALQKYGAVQSSYYSENGYYSDSNDYYYMDNASSSDKTNHAITIVGWDDNYSKDNFQIKPKNNGAFIVKNSWGENWGQSGYFYISYEDKFIGTKNAVYIAEDIGNIDNIYQYDPLGWCSSSGYGSDTAWFSNVFTASDKAESLDEVGFFATGDNASYEVFASVDYKDTDSLKSINRVSVASGKVEFSGYHTVKLGTPQFIPANSKFAVIVRITVPGSDYPIPIESPVAGYSKNARAEKEQSFIGTSGSWWTDATDSNPDRNVALKAFTTDTVDYTGNLYTKDGSIFASANSMDLDSDKRLAAILNMSKYLYGFNNKLYKLEDAEQAYVDAGKDMDEFAKLIVQKTPFEVNVKDN